jgi:hypothetical protein
MSALLSGSLKLSGDRKAFLTLGKALKNATESTIAHAMGAAKATAASVKSTTEKKLLEVVISGAVEVQDMVKDKVFVQYVLDVTNVITGEMWQVRHRFSEFVDLYKALSHKGFKVPKIFMKLKATSLFKSDEKLVFDRAVELGAFLQTALLVAGASPLLSQFLGDASGGSVGSSSTVSTTFAAIHSLRRGSEKLTAAQELDEAKRLAREHAAKRIHWDDTDRAASVLQELTDLRKTVREKVASESIDGGFIMSIFRMSFCLLLLVTTWSSLGAILDKHHSSLVLRSTGILGLLLALPSTRRATLINIVALLAMTSVAQGLLNSLSQRAESSDLTKLSPAIGKAWAVAVAVMPKQSAMSFLAVPSLLHIAVGTLTALFSSIISAATSSSPWTAFFYLLFLPGLCLLTVRKLGRLIHLYSVFTLVMLIYITTKVVFAIRRTPQSQRDLVYTTIDAVIAPFITYQFGQLKSIFVKFAQVLGGRSDILSEVWTSHLSKLQDSCPNSPPEYVCKMLEKAYGDKLGDIFESFDMVPVASASIGQVHFAVVKGRLEYKDIPPMPSSSATSSAATTTSSSSFSNSQKFLTPLKKAAATSESSVKCSRGSERVGLAVGGVGASRLRRVSVLVSPAMNSRGDSDKSVKGEGGGGDKASNDSVSKLSTAKARTATTEDAGGADGKVVNESTKSSGSSMSSCASDSGNTDINSDSASSDGEGVTTSVVVKIQHENIAQIMTTDIEAAINMSRIAAYFDSKWDVSSAQLIRDTTK